MQPKRNQAEVEVLRSLLDMGGQLYVCRDRQEMLQTVLDQARVLTNAEAGSLYLVQKDRLKFVAVYNQRMSQQDVETHLRGREIPISHESLVGHVALTGEILNIPDSYHLPQGAPFRVHRDLDAATGYRVQSILGIPLNCPDGERVGVLELFNRIDADGEVVPFDAPDEMGLLSLASTAAIMVHNIVLQEELRKVHLNTIFRLSTVAEYRDDDTSEHIRRVSRTSEILGHGMGLDPNTVEALRYASPMHDVGKVGIPDAILLKPGHLTPAQRRVMERHTIVGAEIFIDPEEFVLQMAHDIALCHHERWDGNGYPHGLKGEDIPLPGRIVAVADVFDAIVSKRCYKEACSLEVALDILRKDSGKHFDPDVVEVFFDRLADVTGSYPALEEQTRAWLEPAS